MSPEDSKGVRSEANSADTEQPHTDTTVPIVSDVGGRDPALLPDDYYYPEGYFNVKRIAGQVYTSRLRLT
jgi:hypothetical protein